MTFAVERIQSQPSQSRSPSASEEVLLFDDFEVRQPVKASEEDSLYAAPDSSLHLPLPTPFPPEEDAVEAKTREFTSLLGMGAVVAAALALVVGCVWAGRHIVLTLRGPEMYAAVAVPAGERALRTDLKVELLPPTPINNPSQIISVLPAGRSDVYVIKGGFVSRVHDYDFGAAGDNVHCVFVFETVVSRTIERSFGRELLEVRKIEHMRAAKLLTKGDAPTLALGSPTESILDVLDEALPRITEQPAELSNVASRRLADACLVGGSAALGGRLARGFAASFSMSGKSAYVTYADGVGVTAVTPIQCDLNSFEREYFFQSPVMWEADLAAASSPSRSSSESEEGRAYRLPLWELVHFFQPLLRGSAAGSVSVNCTGLVTRHGRPTACFSGRDVSMSLGQRTWDLAYQSQGGFTSSQVMVRYDVQSKTCTAAEFKGRLSVTRVSEDHPLYRTTFLEDPQAIVTVAGLRRDEKPWGDSLAAWPARQLP